MFKGAQKGVLVRRKGAKRGAERVFNSRTPTLKTALKAAPLQKASEGAPERRPEGARTASRGRQNGVQCGAKRAFKGAQNGVQRGAKRVFKGRQKNVQWSAKRVFKGAQKGCSKRCQNGV